MLSENSRARGSAVGAPPPAGDRGLDVTLILALGTFAVGTDAFIVAGFLPAMAGDLDVSVAAAGQSVTAFAITYAALAPVIATVTAGVPRRRLLMVALLVLCAANVVAALAPTFALLLIGRILSAVGAAAYTPTASAVSASLVRPQLRARALAVVIGGLTVATALGVPLGNVLGGWLGWRGALGLVAALCAVGAAGVVLLMPAVPGNPRVPLKARLAVLRRPAVTSVLSLTVFGMTASYTVYAYSVPAFESVGAGDAIPAVLFLYGLGAVAGNICSGYFTDRVGAVRVLTGAYLAMALGLGMLALLAAQEISAAPLAIVLAAVWGAASWAQTPPQQHRLIAEAPQEAPLVVSLNSSSIYLGIGAGTLLGGLFLPLGPPVVFGAGAAIALLSLGALGLSVDLGRKNS
ncbi:MFS transporter [Nocardia jiangsuensis]|uniref:MFS transporter n=1 Tax=Nocardia jiangsuensis TaxID=1691563 RepID=A0ABV8DZQ4_9NOCA